MDDYESDQAIVAAREAVPRDRGFIVGTGRESTQAAIKATEARRGARRRRRAGAHARLLQERR